MRKIKLYMEKEGDDYVVYYVEPYTQTKHPIHSLKDKAHAEIYLDGVMSGIQVVRKMIETISNVATRVPNY